MSQQNVCINLECCLKLRLSVKFKLLMFPKILWQMEEWNGMEDPCYSFQLVQERAVLIRIRVTRISVKQNKGKFKENFNFQNPVSLLWTELEQ